MMQPLYKMANSKPALKTRRACWGSGEPDSFSQQRKLTAGMSPYSPSQYNVSMLSMKHDVCPCALKNLHFHLDVEQERRKRWVENLKTLILIADAWSYITRK